MIPVVRVKDGVTFLMGEPGGLRILSAFDRLAFNLGQDVTITCGSDNHGPDDPHTKGKAYDLRTRDLDDETIRRMILFLRNDLGSQYFTVLYERLEAPAPNTPLAGLVTVNPNASAPHIHVQVRKNTIYPPV